MALKIAVASSDGVNVDLHFGKADSVLIQEYEENNGTKAFVKKEIRKIPVEAVAASSTEQKEPCGTVSEDGVFTCGRCHGGGGCCGGGGGKISPRVEKFLDCRAVIAAQIGDNVRRQFERNAVSVFDIELPVSEALEKLAAYYNKFGE